ncbi:GBA2-like protein, partial [Mya arenaria]
MANRNPDNSLTTPKECIKGLPDFGWRVKLDYECTEKCKPFQSPRLSQIPSLVGLGLRYTFGNSYMCYCSGCPIGGIGAGSIGRGYRGEFCRFHMVPGMYDYHIVQADSFIVTIRKGGQTVYQKVLTGHRVNKTLKLWEWGFPLGQGTYQALYPRAWTVYSIPEHNIRLLCRQISPVIAHNYEDSSYPMAAFIWEVENEGKEDLDVAITFTFKNGTGGKKDFHGGCWTESFQHTEDGVDPVTGVMIHQRMQDMPCTYAVSAKETSGVSVSHCLNFDPQGNGAEVWTELLNNGTLKSKQGSSEKTKKGKDVAAAVSLLCTATPGTTQTLEFGLTWDMPVIHFRAKEVQYSRRYAKWFGKSGDASPKMAAYCLQHYLSWEQQIEAWQGPTLNSRKIPAWYKALLFNELYYVSDGGTVWLHPLELPEDDEELDEENVVDEYGKFAYLEGHEYRMYNTYDVHFYASFALIMLWPKLQLSLQYDLAKAVVHENPEVFKYCMGGHTGLRKVRFTVPHDMGDPEDEPWVRVNSYNIHPTADWKDLNLKFILQVYRDYHATSDEAYLKSMYPVMKTLVERSLLWDKDNDGLIENGGFADQTFDAWIVEGASAYCGGMWVCALRMFVQAGRILGHTEDVEKYTETLNKAKESSHGYHDSVMADQLAGNWYMRAAGISDKTVFPPDHVKSALETVYKNNVMGFADGNMGAINGTRPDGKKDITSCQSEEFWTGVTSSLAAQMVQEDMLEEAFQTLWGNYNVCWEWLGLMFQSPEAYMTSKHFRSLGYMRALAVWAVQWALEKYQPQLFPEEAKSGSSGAGDSGGLTGARSSSGTEPPKGDDSSGTQLPIGEGEGSASGMDGDKTDSEAI